MSFQTDRALPIRPARRRAQLGLAVGPGRARRVPWSTRNFRPGFSADRADLRVCRFSTSLAARRCSPARLPGALRRRIWTRCGAAAECADRAATTSGRFAGFRRTTATPCGRFGRSISSAAADLIRFRISADGFLHRMVRTVVGTLLEVGRGRRPAETLAGVVEARRREAAGLCAPAHGLYLAGVRFRDGYDSYRRPAVLTGFVADR